MYVYIFIIVQLRQMYRSQWGSLAAACSLKKPSFLLQFTRESVSGTASHACCVWTCNEIKGLYDEIIITIVPSYTGKNITRSLPVALLLVLCTCNNTHSNKLVIFSSIAWYYGDTCIVTQVERGQVIHLFRVQGLENTLFCSVCSGWFRRCLDNTVVWDA